MLDMKNNGPEIINTSDTNSGHIAPILGSTMNIGQGTVTHDPRNRPAGYVLGIDPSYTCTGLVVLNCACKVITFSTIRLPTGKDRMLRAGKALHTFMQEVGQRVGLPSQAIIEDAAYGAPSRTVVAKLKELTGVFKFIIEAHDVDWLELSPTSAKKWITGKGTAEKYIVARELKRNYGIQFKDDKGFDLSDAAALAVWGVKHDCS